MNEENNNSSTTPDNTETGAQAALNHMKANKINALLWMTRIGTVIFTVLSLFSDYGVKTSSYQRSLLCNAATSALRLHQRLPRVQLSIEFGAILLLEDSCHYLLYSLLFIYSMYPVHMALLPIVFYAVLHSASYSMILLNKLGQENSKLYSLLNSIVTNHQHKILRIIAFSEICVMPLLVFMIFSGKGSFVTAFAYYRFLTLRYASRRNPYTRAVFADMRTRLEHYANAEGTNPSIQHFCHKIINTFSWMAPALPQQQ